MKIGHHKQFLNLTLWVFACFVIRSEEGFVLELSALRKLPGGQLKEQSCGVRDETTSFIL